MPRILVITLAFLFSSASLAQDDKYELYSIKFEGNNQFSSSVLRDIILSEETPWWFWKFLNSFTPLGSEPVYFDSSSTAIDLTALKDFYNANSFFLAQFSYEYDVDSTAKRVNLIYKIIEGPPSYYGNVQIKGIEKVPSAVAWSIQQEIAVDTTDHFSQKNMELKIEKALAILLNNGYMLASFDSTIIYQDTLYQKAEQEIYFTTHQQFVIDTVVVEKRGEGAPFVEEDLLSKITGISPGEIYNFEKIKRSQVRLFRTGLFNLVVVNPVEEDTAGNRVPLKIDGSIGRMNELSPEVILNNQQSALNVGLGIAFIKKNFLGEARKLTIGSSFGVQDFFNIDYDKLIKRFSFRDTTLLGYIDARLKIEQPFLFNRPILGTWENYATINKQRNFNITTYGSKATFEFELPRYTFVNFLSTSYNVERTHELYRTRNDSLSNKLLSILGVDIGKTTADDILFPTQGLNLSLNMEEANSIPHLISKILNYKFEGALFYKVLATGSFYIPMNRKKNSIFAIKIRSGHLQAYHGDYAGIPLNRTFFAGGSNSVRGWRSNELRPSDADTVRGIIGENVKGGTFLLEGNFELRYRFIEELGTVLFYDYGNTWIGYKDFRYDELAMAAGIGFRYYTPIAPFRIDFGFKFYDPSSKKFIWQDRDKSIWSNLEFHFGIGEAF
jgi:outer membrane protein insertion porin family